MRAGLIYCLQTPHENTIEAGVAEVIKDEIWCDPLKFYFAVDPGSSESDEAEGSSESE